LLQLSRVMALVLKPWYFGNDLTAVTGYWGLQPQVAESVDLED
jgi:hypothetical protein